MTSRLKRKLNDLGVDTASNKANENYCLIGTPLPPLEKSKDAGEFVPLWKQEVRDEKGRRRLHGAFTGGFSAGYFNSVGSKEGWAPATFTSSRTDRAKAKQARPEDFMDEEDLAELRESQKLVDTSESMDLDFWGKRGPAQSNEDDSLVNALQNVLLPEPVDSAGGKILKKMGWRSGQGIGPKLTYEQQRREAKAAHSTLGPDAQPQEPEDHEIAKQHLFPRRDTKIAVIARKDAKHGVGYDPGADLNTIVNERGGAAQSGPNISTGFGLGALNDADEDDLDVYDRGMNHSANRRVAYEDDEEDHDRISIRKHEQGKVQEIKNPKGRRSGVDSFFQSGVPCLPNFVLASKPVSERSLYPPPIVPEGWTADPRRVWEADQETLREVSRPMEDIKNLPSSDRRLGMTIDQRASVLGEHRTPKEKRSVFDYLSPKDRERLKHMASGQAKVASPALPKEEPDTDAHIAEAEATVPRLDAQVAKMALHGFQPFTTDPVKQSRYTAYLKAQAAGEDSVPFSQHPGQNADNFRRELQDYARSATIFKPVSGAMAGRFARASLVESGPKAIEGLHQPTQESSYLSIPGKDDEKEPVKEESPKEHAARLGMFGPLTREVKPWIPAKLLCKRFGVKEPEVEHPAETQGQNESSSTSQWQSEGLLAITDGFASNNENGTKISDGKGEGTSSAANGPKERDLSNIGFGDEDETQGRDLLTYQKPSMDIFKAIFASDEEDEGEDEETDSSKPVDSNGGVPPFGLEGVKQEPLSEPALGMREVQGANVMPSGHQVASELVDTDSFKPKFVPRTKRETKGDEKDKPREKEKKRKKTKTLVSFDVEEGAEPVQAAESGRARERDNKKQRKEKKEKGKKSIDEVMDDDSMWVEKATPVAVQHLDPSIVSISITGREDVDADATVKETGPQRGRKRAIDFM